MGTMVKVKSIHSPAYQEFVSELARERIRLNISQSELASMVGVNQSDISKIEKYEKRLDVLELKLILNALRVSQNVQLKRAVSEFIGMVE